MIDKVGINMKHVDLERQ